MKKQLLSCICGGLAYILPVNSSFAQEQSFKELPPVTITVTASKVTINAKINSAFEQFFKNASHITWYEVDRKFLVKFIQNDQLNRALFTKNGHRF